MIDGLTDEMIMQMTPGERIELVWELTKAEWRLKEPGWQESRLRRDIVRVIRPGDVTDADEK